MADKFQLKALITGVDKLSPMLKGVGQNAGKLRKQLESSGLGKISMGDIAGGGAFAMPFIAGAKAAISFESKMADVRKVVDFDSPTQFKQMGLDIREMSTRMPMAADGIAQIVAAGGQSGIARAELMGFASDAIKMSIAFDQTADVAGEMMAKWRTAFDIGQSGVVELADKINHLGNTGPANTKQISGIVTKIGALGGVAGLSTGQIAAMGATLAGVGVQEEVAATGMKNFMLALTAGNAATKAQSETLKALRMDAKGVAKGMQKDAQGTILKVMTAISKVDKTQQSAVLTQLFGKESISAIAPMLTKLDLLKGNFEKVGDASKYAGSMQKEYDARLGTTENAITMFKSKIVDLGVSVGEILLPPINGFLDVMGPLVTGVSRVASANPWLIKGLLGAAAGFVGLRLAVMGGVVAMKLLSAVTSMSPVGLLVRGIALAAGMLIANWSSVAPFFEACWDKIKEYAGIGWEMFKTVAGFTPLGMIVKNWEPIVAFFKQMWERVRPYIEPMIDAAKWVGGKVGGMFGGGEQQTAAPFAPGAGFAQSTVPTAMTSPIQAAQSPLPAAQATQKQNLQGELQIKFQNAPPGTKVDAVSNQPGVEFFSQPVGRRSLSAGY
jgi:TP901 family phage tail tape measure protein